MWGYLLLPVMNITLYLGMARGDEYALNIAVFIMWIYAIISFFGMIVRDDYLLKQHDKPWINKVPMAILITCSITQSVYWGYFFVPSLWLLGVAVRYVRKYELNNRKTIR